MAISVLVRGLYLRGVWYHFRKQIEKRIYHVPLKVRKGQEHFLSDRLKQAMDEVFARHYGLEERVAKRKFATLREYSDRYLQTKAQHASYKGMRQRMDRVIKLMGDIDLSQIDSDRLTRLEEKLLAMKGRGGNGTMSKATLNRYFEMLRGMLALAVKENYIAQNPLRDHQFFIEEEKGRALSLDEIHKLLTATRKAKETARGKIVKAAYDMIRIALYTSLRLGEIMRLRWEYIEGDVVTLPVSAVKFKRRVTGDTQKKPRIVYLTPEALAIVNAQPRIDEYVFDLGGRVLSSVSAVMSRLGKDAGIPDFHFHMLRHTVSTIVAQATDLATAKQTLGHSNIRTTLRYTHPDGNSVRKAVAEMTPLIAKASLAVPDGCND